MGHVWVSVHDFSPNSVSTLKGSCDSCKGRCLIRVLTLERGIFPTKKNCIKWLLSNLDMRFDCARSHNKMSVSACVLGSFLSAAFHLQLPYKVAREILKCISTAQARTKCVSAFWAQSVPRHFPCNFLHKVTLLMSLVKS